ncbi:hypothetical protein [Salinicola sp. CPA57]|uniref:hypothetical protein n=1 Tax=Salinicola sp. CPA57 TaxID=1949080 RepID=UPI001300A49D|nr:hypothetical protein [Salinicola sp. CPA57]
MKILFEIDNDGYFLGDVIISDNESVPENVIAHRPPQPCIKPRWVNGGWIEEAQDKLELINAGVDQVRATKRTLIASLGIDYDNAANELLRNYPENERLTFSQQQLEAEAYVLDKNTDTPILNKILEGRNGDDGTETLDDLVAKVLANVDRFSEFQIKTGYRQRVERRILDAQSLEELESISWEF